MKRPGVWLIFFSALLCASLSGCKSGHVSESWPKVLHYAFSPQADQLQSGTLSTPMMRQYLQSQLHIPVDLVQVQGYAPTIEAMRADKVDVAHFGALSYLIAAQKAGAEAIVSRGTPDGKLGGYRSLIAVPKDSPIHSMQDLKAHAKDIVFAFADPASTSGDLYPRVGLKALGIDPERDFKRVLYADGHLADLMAIKSGKVDAGGFSQAYMTRLIAEGKMKPDDIRVIWTSELIPNEPIAVRKDLPEQLKKEIRAAILAIPSKDPALWANLSKSVYSADSGTTYIPVSDATYDRLRQYASQIKQFNFLEK
jgi:phosphonate transport system substrate-binding protein